MNRATSLLREYRRDVEHTLIKLREWTVLFPSEQQAERDQHIAQAEAKIKRIDEVLGWRAR